MPDKKAELFDEWPEKYDRWFATPIGTLVKKCEEELLFDLLKPTLGEKILDAGCGTGVFTIGILSLGAHVTGLDISLPMLLRAGQKAKGSPFQMVSGNLLNLPFRENSFDKVASVTALEFIEDGQGALKEFFRVTRRGGSIVVATLNSLSPWALRRKAEARKGHALFQKAIFRSPDDLDSIAPVKGVIRTAVHFQKEDDPGKAVEVELAGRQKGLLTGAFLAGHWQKP